MTGPIAGRPLLTEHDSVRVARAPTSLQDIAHAEDHDYVRGSPHLTHLSLNRWLVDCIRREVQNLLDTNGRARVLEVGAGHGAFTDHALAAGATVTITEMSRASCELLRRRYRHNSSARVLFDSTGDSAALTGERFDLVLCVAVLHHIPDYLSAIEGWISRVETGGSFMSFQDPLWYPRQSRPNVWAHRGAHYLWRIGQGDLVEGVRSVIRRKREDLEESNPRDMVEYHVLRQGCDEEAIAARLRRAFSTVEILSYWSTSSRLLQSAGEKLGLRSDFGVVASGAHHSASDDHRPSSP